MSREPIESPQASTGASGTSERAVGLPSDQSAVGCDSAKPLDCVGVPLSGIGKSDFLPTPPEKKVFPAKRSLKRRLKPTQEAFIKHYTDPNSPAFGNGTAAYLKSHPGCGSRQAAGVRAHEAVRNSNVQALMNEHWGVERLEAELERNLKACWDSQKLGDHREGVKVYAQLTGNWKEKQEVTHLEDAQKDAIRKEVSKHLGIN